MALTRWQKRILAPYNNLLEYIGNRNKLDICWKELREVEAKARFRTDISSHLRTIFIETVQSKPNVIVELGVKKGFSNFALSRAAMVTGAVLISIDNRDFSRALDWGNWIFIQMDDLDFAEQFPAWCKGNNIKPSIDVLFIDTSHEYEHTKKEIAAYFPLLSANAKVMLHDTNCSGWYRRENYTIDRSWDSKRGVIRATEDYFGRKFNEKEKFVDLIGGWLIKHNPICNGLMSLERNYQIPKETKAK